MVKLALAATLAIAAFAVAEPIPKVKVHNRHDHTKTHHHHHKGTKTAGVEAPTATAIAEPIEDTTVSISARSAYKQYSGKGSTAEGWPSEDEWVSWDAMVAANKGIMGTCSNGETKNSDEENDNVISAIESASASSGVDKRYILATVLQESNGCVRVQTTNYGVRNPGLMQDHDGAGTCNDNGKVQNPCPASQITQMVKDGAEGTAAGDGLKQVLAQVKTKYGYTGAQQVYAAARTYNSGSLAASGILQCGIATHCYASDIANRMIGFTSTSACTYDTDTSLTSC